MLMAEKPVNVEDYVIQYCTARVVGDPVPETYVEEVPPPPKKLPSRNSITIHNSVIRVKALSATNGRDEGDDDDNATSLEDQQLLEQQQQQQQQQHKQSSTQHLHDFSEEEEMSAVNDNADLFDNGSFVSDERSELSELSGL